MAAKLTTRSEAKKLRPVTDAVHSEGGKILMQILHAGRYSYSPIAVAPSSIASPIWMFDPARPIGMPSWWVKKTINDFALCCSLAQEAGFDGVEIMGSEGYLINQFIVSHTNKRNDIWGGSFENRCRFPLEVIKACRKAGGPDFMLMYRLSMLDLIPNGSARDEVYKLAEEVCDAGVDIINTGIGWHEARIPTIATSVPRASFTWVTKKCREHLHSKGYKVPLVTTNRINTPSVAEEILKDGDADLISMARPLLADPEFVAKTRSGNASKINICIGCNQACLDHTFSMKIASCLVNPVACHETKLTPVASAAPKNIAVVGAGPAGCAFALCAAECGHNVTLFERNKIGGQFNVAKKIPGKEEFQSSIDYWQLSLTTNPRIKSYLDVILGKKVPGRRVAVIGAGGIGFDVSVFLTHSTPPADRHEAFKEFAKEWGVDTTLTSRGFLTKAEPSASKHDVFLFQRKKGKVGAKLGATTGWIHRLALRHHDVKQFAGVEYKSFNNNEFVYVKDGVTQQLQVDSIVLCHGQKSIKDFVVKRNEGTVHYIGGCKDPSELDAKKAILDGHTLALKL
ncbi:FAD FMN-binding pyridine nucleotide-disulphide oxidoreductase, putative [Bodo saltans]|uniref:FAD FMN-binding pyridine nucleotide-disulphide oxidoreductase, putative n=1 Tax=Bodo saltans TaxID=75058 RepID=A0A0S4JST7_BODSA|nr:FAD FMN-binding pyridine nucleotide-disulphide oxidoreductase, putative [Bodo saltans]|eukprot:CUG93339.1 FAD FMN-binding pyridine nucleotide-disulphide oxidoreductase, putative [Bodo saltans]